ncbi:MAG: hypothetical protein IPG96_17705 [Proteobacteria bacterium]|nr:hypothetical protein [Pseudomonadota bacterium]
METGERTTPRAYWAMRTDRDNAPLIIDELRQGRLRQGWGYVADQDLRRLVKKREAGLAFTPEEQSAWRNRPMLGGRNAINPGDIVLLPNLPNPREFLLVEIAGPYDFAPMVLNGEADINNLGCDYGHILPVKIEQPKPIPMQDEQMHAGLRASLTCRSRLWSVADYASNIEELLASPRKTTGWNLERAFQRMIADAMAASGAAIEEKLGEYLAKRFSRAELEVPCEALVGYLFPGAKVEPHGGPAEHGADIVATWDDPLAASGCPSNLSWRAVFQVKDWRGKATELGALHQLEDAIRRYSDEYPVRGAYLLTLCEGESEEFRLHREEKGRELQCPITLVGQKRLLGLFREYAISRGPG